MGITLTWLKKQKTIKSSEYKAPSSGAYTKTIKGKPTLMVERGLASYSLSMPREVFTRNAW